MCTRRTGISRHELEPRRSFSKECDKSRFVLNSLAKKRCESTVPTMLLVLFVDMVSRSCGSFWCSTGKCSITPRSNCAGVFVEVWCNAMRYGPGKRCITPFAFCFRRIGTNHNPNTVSYSSCDNRYCGQLQQGCVIWLSSGDRRLMPTLHTCYYPISKKCVRTTWVAAI